MFVGQSWAHLNNNNNIGYWIILENIGLHWTIMVYIEHCVSIFECPEENHNSSSPFNPGQYLAIFLPILKNILHNISLYWVILDDIVEYW